MGNEKHVADETAAAIERVIKAWNAAKKSGEATVTVGRSDLYKVVALAAHALSLTILQDGERN